MRRKHQAFPFPHAVCVCVCVCDIVYGVCVWCVWYTDIVCGVCDIVCGVSVAFSFPCVGGGCGGGGAGTKREHGLLASFAQTDPIIYTAGIENRQRVFKDLLYRRPGFLRRHMIWLQPFPLTSASCLSFSVCLCVTGRARWRERGEQLPLPRGGHWHLQIGRMLDSDWIRDLRLEGVKDRTFLKNQRQRSCLLPRSLSIPMSRDRLQIFPTDVHTVLPKIGGDGGGGGGPSHWPCPCPCKNRACDINFFDISVEGWNLDFILSK